MAFDLDALLDKLEARLLGIEAAAAKHARQRDTPGPLERSPVGEADAAIEAMDEMRMNAASLREPIVALVRGVITVAQRRRLLSVLGHLDAVIADLS